MSILTGPEYSEHALDTLGSALLDIAEIVTQNRGAENTAEFFQYIAALFELYRTRAEHGIDSLETERSIEVLDDLWHSLNHYQRLAANKLADYFEMLTSRSKK